MTPTPRPASKAKAPAANSNLVVILVCGVIAVLGLGIGIALLAGGDDSASGPSAAEGDAAFGDVNVVGTPLAPFESTEDDAAVGQVAPQIVGQTPTGAGSVAGGRGAPTMVAFLAHWCPHCQRELPLLVDMQEAGDFDGVRTTAVLTGTDPNAPNYPPADWLVREGWTGNVLLDDHDQTAAMAYGLSSYPYLVFLDSAGEVTARTSGEITTGEIQSLLDDARQS